MYYFGHMNGNPTLPASVLLSDPHQNPFEDICGLEAYPTDLPYGEIIESNADTTRVVTSHSTNVTQFLCFPNAKLD